MVHLTVISNGIVMMAPHQLWYLIRNYDDNNQVMRNRNDRRSKINGKDTNMQPNSKLLT